MKDCIVGYTGGKEENPTYQAIKDSTESFLVEFDPDEISYEQILDVWADQHAPYYPSKCQYRSGTFDVPESSVATILYSCPKPLYRDFAAIFYTNDEQKVAAGAFNYLTVCGNASLQI